ncbi:hypothetical protein CULT_140079 [[Clostridium] ultunense Esp]|nr:hypothetical protein CULT_140079 [[Clostridium] ultunense Esp]
MAVVFQKTRGLTDVSTHYCPGCTHGIIHRLVGEVLEELGVLDNAIGVAPVAAQSLLINILIVICMKQLMVEHQL